MVTYFDPRTSAYFHRVEYDPVADVELFSSKPAIREYGVRLPASELTIAYRALNAAREPLATGRVSTDLYGKVEIAGISEDAVAIEIRAGDVSTIVPVDPAG